MSIDCSLQAQEDRKQQLRDLLAKRNSGVQSVSDRSRSVTYQSPGVLNELIRAVKRDIDYCEGGGQRPRRVIFLPYSKWF
jgi:hypothetical protein